MELTLNNLISMIEEMKKNNAGKLHLDVSIDSCGYSVESIDFDIWKNGEFAKTVLTKKDWYAIMITESEREVNKMKTVIIEYAVINPVTLFNKIEKVFPGAIVSFTDIDKDYFELSVWGCTDLEMLEDVLAEYV